MHPVLNKKKIQVDSVDTVIGADTVLEGTIRSKTSLRVEGEIHGEIYCDGDITVGKEGKLDHQVSARNITLAGTIEGNVDVQEKLHILSSGKLVGKVAMKSLMIEEGATFDGESHMKNGEEKDFAKEQVAASKSEDKSKGKNNKK